MEKRIEDAIKQLGLKQEDIDSISVGNMDRICEIANVSLYDLMYYLRFIRK